MVKIGAGHKLDANTVALWRLNETVSDTSPKNVLIDVAAGARHLTAPGSESTWPFFRPVGPAGQYARGFNGSSTQATRAGDATCVSTLIGQHTFECLYYPITTGTNRIIVSYDNQPGTDSNSANNYLTRWLVSNTGMQQIFWESGSGVNQGVNQTTGSGVVNGVWNYICYTKDASNYNFYLNGTLQQSIAIGTNATGGSAASWFVGTDGAPQQFLNGYIRNLKLTSGAKNAATVLAAQNYYLENFSLQEGDSALIHWAMKDMGDVIEGVGNVKTHLFAATPSAGVIRGTPPLVNDDGASVTFVSSYLGSATADNTFPAYSGIDVIRQTLQDQFTFEAWIKENQTLPATSQGIFALGNAAAETEDTNHLGFRINANRAFDFFSEYSTGNDSFFTFSYTLPYSDDPYHVALRRNETISGTCTADLFVNAEHKATISGMIPFTGGTSEAFTLGRAPSSVPFLGSMDDVRLSNIARTNEEILESYKRGHVALDLGGSYLVSGTWSNYVGSGSGIEVNVYDKEYRVCVGSTTTSGAGHYHLFVPRNTGLHFAEAREDSNHLGRTDDDYPQ